MYRQDECAGVFKLGYRIDIESRDRAGGKASSSEAAGLPTVYESNRPEDLKVWVLCQRAERSPHALLWESEPYSTQEQVLVWTPDAIPDPRGWSPG